jgi:hypothetical protein
VQHGGRGLGQRGRAARAICSAVNSIGSWAAFASSFSSRSYLVAIPCLARMVWTVGELTPTPPSFSIALRRQQPHAGCSKLSARIRSTVWGGVVCGWVLWTGGKSFKPASPCVWKRRLYS